MSGLCECGCGEKTPIATMTNRQAGRVAGQPCRFVRGHNARIRNPNACQGPEYEVDPTTGCWEWMHARADGLYGKIWNGEKSVQAHRHYYEKHVGPIPEGHVIHHLCRNRGCVNPEHLEAMADAEHRRMHSTKHGQIVDIVLRSGVSLDELKERLGVS